MKKVVFLSVLFTMFASLLFAQAPSKFTYQAVVRDATNHLVTNAPVGIRIRILQGSVYGNILYAETHNAVSNNNGLVTIVIGSGNLLQGSISEINWGEGPIFLQMEIDPSGGTNYSITSTQQLLSVPYALYASETANSFSGDYNDLTNLPQIPIVPTNVSDFNNDVGYITMDSIPLIPTVPTNVSAFTNDAGYLTGYAETDPQFNAWDKDYNDLTNRPIIPTVPTNVSAFVNDVPYLTTFTEQQVLSIRHDTIFLTGGSFVKLPESFDGDYNSLTNKPILFNGDYNSLTNQPQIPTVPTNVSAFTNDAGYLTEYTETDPLFNAWDKNYNDLTNRPVIPTVPTNVSAFVNDVPYLTTFTEQQVLSIRHDTIFLTGGSFVKLPETLTEDQVSQMIHQCCSSMHQYVDSVVAVTLNTVLGQQLTDAFKHYLDSLAEALAQTYIDSVNVPCPIVSHDSVFPTSPCPEAPYVFDWDGNVYNTVKIGNQCWMRENLRSWHFPDGTLIPSTTISYYYNSGPFGPNRIKPDNNIDNVATYGYLYNYEAVFRTSDTSILNNSIPSGVQGICPDGWHIPSMAEWQQLVDFMGNYSMYICDDQTYYVAKALSAQTGWRSDCTNLCAISTDLSANNASGFSALPAGEAWGNDPHYFGDRAYFWSATQSTNNYNEAKIFKLDYPLADCDLNYYCGWTGAMSVRCLRDPGTPTPSDTTPVIPPCPTVSITVSGNTSICEGSSTTLTATGAQTYVWSNGQSGSIITVNSADTYAVTGMDANGCSGSASISVSVNPSTEHMETVTACGSYTWIRPDGSSQILYQSGTYTYPYINTYGCSSMETLILTLSPCDTTPVVHISDMTNITTTSAVVNAEVASDGGATVTSRGICWGLSPLPTIDGPHTTEGGGVGTFSSALTGLIPGTTYFVQAYAINSLGIAYSNSSEWFTTLCGAPTNLAVSNITMNSATLSWNADEDAGNQLLQYKKQMDNEWLSYAVFDNNMILTGLESNTVYEARVRQTCIDGSDGEWSETLTFTTLGCTQVSVVISGNTSICEGTTTTLIATGAQTYMWSSGQSSSNITVNSAGTYSVTGTDAKGCEGMASVMVNLMYGTFTSAEETVTGSFLWHRSDNTDTTIFESGTYIYRYLNANGCSSRDTLVLEINNGGEYVSDGQPCPGVPTVTDIDNNVYNTVKIGNQCWMKENIRTTRYADETMIPISSTLSETVAYRYAPNGNSSNVEEYGYLYNWPAAMHGEASSTNAPSGVQGICPTGWHLPSDLEWTQLEDYLGGNEEYRCGGTPLSIAKALSSQTGWLSTQYTFTDECNVGNMPENNNVSGFSARPAGYYNASLNMSTHQFFNYNYHDFGKVTFFWSATTHQNGLNANHPGTRSVHSDQEQFLTSTNFSKYPAYSVRCLHDEAVQNGDTMHIDTSIFIPSSAQSCPGAPTVADHEGNVYHTVLIGNQCWTRENMRCSTSPNGYLSESDSNSLSNNEAFYYNYVTSAVPLIQRGYLYNWAGAMDTTSTDVIDVSFERRRGICPEGWHIPSDLEWFELEQYVLSGIDTFSTSNPGTLYRGFGASRLAGGSFWLESSVEGAPGNAESSDNNATGFSAVPAGERGHYFLNSRSKVAFWSSTSISGYNAYYRSIDFDQAGVYRHNSASKNWGVSVRCLRDDNSGGDSTQTTTTANSCTIPTTHPAQTGSTYQGNGFNGANYGLETISEGLIISVTDYDGNEYPIVQIGSQCWLAENMRCTHSPSTGTYIVNNQFTSGTNVAFTYSGKMARWYNNDSVTYVSKHYGLLYNWNAAVDVYNTSYGELSIKPSNYAVNIVFSDNKQGICPIGWHVPSDEDWTIMTDYVSSQSENQCYTNSSYIGKSLASTMDWDPSTEICAVGNNLDENNATGFSAVPAGFFDDLFLFAGNGTFFWSSSGRTNSYSHYAWIRQMQLHSPSMSRYSNSKSLGYSVRCLRDDN